MTATFSLLLVLTAVAPSEVDFHVVPPQEEQIDPRTFEAILKARLQELRSAQPAPGADMQKLLEQLRGLDLTKLDPKTRKSLMEMAAQIRAGEKPDFNDPQLIEALHKLQLAGLKDLQISPEMEKWVKEILRTRPDLWAGDLRPSDLIRMQPIIEPMPMPIMREQVVVPEDNFRSWLLDRMRDLDGSGLGSSDALRDFIRDLAQPGTSGSSGSWLQGFNFSPGNWTVPNFKMPSLPNIKLPSLGFGRMPDVQTPELPATAAGIGGPLAWLVVVGLLALLLWRLAGRVDLPMLFGGSRVPQALLVHFDPRVADREQLIRAFEALSLTRLGETVQTWNHRRIADRLAALDGVDRDTTASAARRLADLYEQARYSPEFHHLTDQDFAKAQQDLTLLAGTTPA